MNAKQIFAQERSRRRVLRVVDRAHDTLVGRTGAEPSAWSCPEDRTSL
ncbi:MAG: hypothetical protein ACLR3C_14785 [Eggerthella lenta]